MKRDEIKKLDKAFSAKVREKGACERCGKTETLQCAHIFPRTRYSVRWDYENALCLCYACHIHWAHKNPCEFAEWVIKKLGKKAYEGLKLRSNTLKKETYDSIRERIGI